MGQDQLAGHARCYVDGVPVLWSPVPGPLRAGLVLGAGQAHETLPTHGLTHLVEHLVLSETADGPHAFNGATDLGTTSFVVAGAGADVVGHLQGVCRALADLPTHRLEHERGVLRVEAAQRGTSSFDRLLSWRWGAQGFALPTYREYGLDTASGEQARSWSHRFGADRAVLWLSGPPPADLRLPLRGRATPVQAPPLALPELPMPGAFLDAPGGVAFSLLVPRTAPASALRWLLHHRLQTRLRHDLGLTYGPQVGDEVLDAQTRLVQVVLNCLPENDRAVTAAVCAVLRELALVPPTEQEWARMQAQRELALQDRGNADVLTHLDHTARQLLLGGQPQSAEEYERRTAAVEPGEVAHLAEEVLGTLCVGTPELAEVPAELARPLPLESGEQLRGERRAATGRHPAPEMRWLDLSDRGVTRLRADGTATTVRFDRLAAVLRHDDGALGLVGVDATVLEIAPEQWRSGRELLQGIEARLSSDVFIPAGPRTPTPKRPRRSRSTPTTRALALLLWAIIPLFGLAWSLRALYEDRHELRQRPLHVQVLLGCAVVLGVTTTVLAFTT